MNKKTAIIILTIFLTGCASSDLTTQNPLEIENHNVNNTTSIKENEFDIEQVPLKMYYADFEIDTTDEKVLENSSEHVVTGQFIEQRESRILDATGIIVTRYIFEIEKNVKGTFDSSKIYVDVLGGYLPVSEYTKQAEEKRAIKAEKSPDLIKEKYPNGVPVSKSLSTGIVAQNFGTNPMATSFLRSLEPQKFVIYIGENEEEPGTYSINTITHGFKVLRGDVVYSVGYEDEIPKPFSVETFGN